MPSVKTLKLLAMFPGIWLACILALLLSHANPLPAVFIADIVGLGALTVAAVTRRRAARRELASISSLSGNWRIWIIEIALYVIAVLAIFSASDSIAIMYHSAFNEPIGLDEDLGWGWPPCHRELQLSIKGDRNVVAILRRSVCAYGLFAGQSYLTYFVFIAKPGATLDSSNLVFRYEPSLRAKNPLRPRIIWLNSSALLITLKSRDVSRISKKRTVFGGIQINYRFT